MLEDIDKLGELHHHAIFLFYSKSLGIQSRLAFSDDKKHCDVMVSDGRAWVAFQYTGRGIEHRVFKAKDCKRILKHLKTIPELSHYIVVSVHQAYMHGWKPFIVSSCNEICRKIAMVETGWTFNPRHLYTKLTKLDGKTNFRVINTWSR
jgi:hypothetical protein